MPELDAINLHMPLEWGGQGCFRTCGCCLRVAEGTQGEELEGADPVRALSFLQHGPGQWLSLYQLHKEMDITLRALEISPIVMLK